MWRQKRRKLTLEQQGTWHTMLTLYPWPGKQEVNKLMFLFMFAELYSIVGRPNVFSYSELRSATENFSSSNRLGEGGYGAVYKVSSSVSTYIYSRFRTCYGILPMN
jgi:hypothetical protein